MGTHWYHSHIGSQRTAGVYGPFIVLEKSEEELKELRVKHTIYTDTCMCTYILSYIIKLHT